MIGVFCFVGAFDEFDTNQFLQCHQFLQVSLYFSEEHFIKKIIQARGQGDSRNRNPLHKFQNKPLCLLRKFHSLLLIFIFYTFISSRSWHIMDRRTKSSSFNQGRLGDHFFLSIEVNDQSNLISFQGAFSDALEIINLWIVLPQTLGQTTNPRFSLVTNGMFVPPSHVLHLLYCQFSILVSSIESLDCLGKSFIWEWNSQIKISKNVNITVSFRVL